MDVTEAIRGRRMVRSFRPDPVPPAVVDRLLDGALRAPTAGNSRGVAWIVLEGPEQTSPYWDATTTAPWRASSRRWPGLSRAPVVALALASPHRYVERYGSDDKRRSGLGPPVAGGGGAAAWPVPYWFGDAAFSAMSLLLGAVDEGLGACFLGNFRGETALLELLGVPTGWRLFGSVLIGHPAEDDHRSASLDRPNPTRANGIHRGRWGDGPA
jgi:nitroreductase